LENKLDGLSAGVKDVLDRAAQEQSNGGPFSEVRGLVADLLQTNVEMAPLVDVALGDAAHHVVLDGHVLFDQLQAETCRVSGRVGFVRLDIPPTAESSDNDLTGQPGVIGRADCMVETAPQNASLVQRLLGRTWFVEKLSDAISLSQSHGGGLRLVTRAGELVESDQTVIVGARHATSGIISRRSQLRALQEELQRLDQQIEQSSQQLNLLRETIDRQERHAADLSDQHKQASAALAESRLRMRTLQERHEQLEKQRRMVDAELQAAIVQQETATRELAAAREQLAAIETGLAEMEAEIHADDRRIDQIDAQRQEHARQATAAKVQMAKSEQRLEGLRLQMSQFEDDQRERTRAILESRAQLSGCQQRRRQSERGILRATSEVAELYLLKEKFARDTIVQIELRETLIAERSSQAAQLQKLRKSLHKLDEHQHQHELSAGEIRHERNTLAERLREDYGIELSQFQHEAEQEQQQREAVEEEIASLRRKINNIGAVNMEALEELGELETRFTALSNQHKDLTQAKESLERIIHKINADSRRLFVETLEAIRTNFQALYRKAFGGGKADIVLEEGVDILEAGVEIIATPPGKPSFNNSLLSGGEKALTAVALLLAIFQYRPSPFCVLDEVDAPFDEANIGRFIDVLKDFLGWTKFIIVTHSKKTMTAATTLYGVTMQESGVSKRVSVKFDDVSEDGHISQAALQREQAAASERGVA
jgi:chromosome segregation protein